MRSPSSGKLEQITLNINKLAVRAAATHDPSDEKDLRHYQKIYHKLAHKAYRLPRDALVGIAVASVVFLNGCAYQSSSPQEIDRYWQQHVREWEQGNSYRLEGFR